MTTQPRPPITIGGSTWASKTALKAYVRSALTTHKPGCRITDPVFLSICTHLYPGAEEVWANSARRAWGVGSGRVGAWGRSAVATPHWAMVGGKFTKVVSQWYPLPLISGIDELGTPRYKVVQDKAYQRWLSEARAIISPQIEQYRAEHQVPRGYDIDHVDPPFQTLLDDWLDRDYPTPQYTLEWWSPHRAEQWALYHGQHATLNAIPAKLNRAKGGAPRKPRYRQTLLPPSSKPPSPGPGPGPGPHTEFW